MNLQQMIALSAIVIFIVVLMLTMIGAVYRYRTRAQLPPAREVSKRRMGWMWVVDDDDSHVAQVLPKHPKRSTVQMYDEQK